MFMDIQSAVPCNFLGVVSTHSADPRETFVHLVPELATRMFEINSTLEETKFKTATSMKTYYDGDMSTKDNIDGTLGSLDDGLCELVDIFVLSERRTKLV
jgi:hypothetical protein